MLKFVHAASLYVFLGAASFWHLLWRPATVGALSGNETVGAVVGRRVRLGLFIGFALFAVSALIDGLVARSFGWLPVLQLVFAAAAVVAWLRSGVGHGTEDPGDADGSATAPNRDAQKARPWTWIGAVLSGALLAVLGMTSRMGEQPGAFPVALHGVHLFSSIVWAGGLLYLASVPWHQVTASASGRPFATVVARFTAVGFAAVALVAATGAVASYVNVYTPTALLQTTYGRALSVKIGLFFVLLLIGLVNFLFVVPGLRRETTIGGTRIGNEMTSRLGTVFRLEAAAVVALLAATGVLASLSPRDSLEDLVRGRWELDLGRGSLVAEMAAGDVPGELQLDLHVRNGGGRPVEDIEGIVVDMEMPAHSMGLRPMEAQFVAPGHYRVRPLLSMEGEWETYITATFEDGEQYVAAFTFEAFEAARSAGMTRRLEPRAIFFEFAAERAEAALEEDYVFSLRDFLQDLIFSLDPRPMYFISGAFWFVAAVFVVLAALRGGFPRWVAPLGMVAMAVGVYFLLSSMLVNAYPTSYATNPVPFTTASIKKGYELYLSHCSVCHGPEGHGDGPMAPFIEPPPEDLRVRHIDAHPDGELFWWFTYGIPGSDMPGNEATMTEEERWHVVNFVRSLHRPVPDGQ